MTASQPAQVATDLYAPAPVNPPGPDPLSSGPEPLSFAVAENFPVALKVLPRTVRRDLLAIYGFARLVDNLGDDYEGNRLDALAEAEAELNRVFASGAIRESSGAVRESSGAVGESSGATREVFLRLQPGIVQHNWQQQHFLDLIEANRQDQIKLRYQTWEELLDYCELSANPVGRLVLETFAVATPQNVSDSDEVCSALQIIEHLQDIGEDYRSGRLYLPQSTCEKFGCDEDLIEMSVKCSLTAVPLRNLVLHMAGRARNLLDSGAQLVGGLRGSAKLAIAGFVAGGQAALDAIEATGGEILENEATPAKLRVLRHTTRLMAKKTTQKTTQKTTLKMTLKMTQTHGKANTAKPSASQSSVLRS